MKAYLGSQDVWDVVQGGFEEPEDFDEQTVAQIAALKKARVKDRKAMYALYRAVDDAGLEKLANAMTSKEAWEILEKTYKGDDRVKQVRLQTLRGEFERLLMKENEGVTEFISRVETVANQLGKNGEPLPANRVVEKILRSLTIDFDNIVCAIEESKDLSKLTVEELAGSLEAYEQRRRKTKEDYFGQALQAKTNFQEKKAFYTQNTQSRARGRGGRGNGRNGRGRRGQEVEREHTSNQNWRGKGRGSWRGGRVSNSNVECYKCGNYGHYAKDCNSDRCYNCGKVGHFAKECGKKEVTINFLTEDVEENGGLLMMSIAEDMQLNNSTRQQSSSTNSMWYLDTGASNHMCGDAHFFKDLAKVEVGDVFFGDDSKVAVKGRGTIWYLQKDGRVGEIRDVYYVPNLKSNILSMGQLMEKGYSVPMKDRALDLKDKFGRLIACVEMKKNRMYKLELKIIQEKCLKLDVQDETMMWHFRFGHLHFDGLMELVKKGMVHGLPSMEFKSKLCEECILDKQSRTSFPRNAKYQAKEQLGLIHTDVCGPITPESFNGKRYFISFVDDFHERHGYTS